MPRGRPKGSKNKPRAKNAPLMARRPSKADRQADRDAEPSRNAHTIARRARIAAILARTARSRAELDAASAGADMRSSADLPVIHYDPPPRQRARRASWRNPEDIVTGGKVVAHVERRATALETRDLHSDIYLPKRSGKRCKLCRLEVHPETGCKEMREWIALAAKVLRGEPIIPPHLVRTATAAPELELAAPSP